MDGVKHIEEKLLPVASEVTAGLSTGDTEEASQKLSKLIDKIEEKAIPRLSKLLDESNTPGWSDHESALQEKAKRLRSILMGPDSTDEAGLGAATLTDPAVSTALGQALLTLTKGFEAVSPKSITEKNELPSMTALLRDLLPKLEEACTSISMGLQSPGRAYQHLSDLLDNADDIIRRTKGEIG